MGRFPLAWLVILAIAACTLSSRPAAASFTPPPLAGGHVVTTAGWLAVDDIRLLNEVCEAIHAQTGYVVDVLVVGSFGDASIDDVTNDTFQTWRPQDNGKDNGILMVFAPSFPPGQRKARIVAGKGVRLSEAQAKSVLFDVIEPRLNGNDVRGAVAFGVSALGKALGAGGDGGAPGDAAAGPPTATAPGASSGSDDGGFPLRFILGVLALAALGAVLYARFRKTPG